jgi:hypothetical protein
MSIKNYNSDTFWGSFIPVSIFLFLFGTHPFTPGVDVEDHLLMTVAAGSGIFAYFKSKVNNEKNTFKRLIETPRGLRVLLSYYIVWVFIHFTFYILSKRSSNNSEIFWPFPNDQFGKSDNELIRAYDKSELFVYLLGPIVLLFVYRLLKKKN